jgi:hypothetical protein
VRKLSSYLYLLLLPVILLSSNSCSTPVSKKSTAPDRNYANKVSMSVIDPNIKKKILDLDPEHISEKDVREVMSKFSAPKIINLNGSIPVVTMDSFSRFLIAMGYPENKVRNPFSGDYSYSSYVNSKKLAGIVAWHYEQEGMMPIIIGHSQGGMLVVKVLYELAGEFNEEIPVWNPIINKSEERHTIVDPLSGIERPVVGLRVGYSSAIGTGKLMRFFLGQWNMLSRLRKIPDTTEEFTGYYIKYDFIGSDFIGLGKASKYYPIGSAVVRNIRLPASYSHFRVPLTEHLAMNNETRKWINNYIPTSEEPEFTVDLDADTDNILFAADIWYRVKKYWCIELQNLMKTTRSEL